MGTSTDRRQWLKKALATGALVSLSRVSAASADPTSIVVPHEAGGGMDLLARRLALALPAQGIAPVVVLNRPGGSGVVGTASVARARSDGHTLLFNGVGHLTTPLLHPEKLYDPTRDFEGILTIGKTPNVLMVHGAKAGDAAALVRSTGETDTYASSGTGSTPHLAAAMFLERLGAQWLHVPYKGTGPAVRALMAGEVRWMFVPANSASAVVKSGRAQALAVAYPRRLKALPDVPTLRELRLPEVDMTQWYALLAPTGTPRQRLADLARASRRALATPELTAFLESQSIEPFVMELADMDHWLRQESSRMRALVTSLTPRTRE